MTLLSRGYAAIAAAFAMGSTPDTRRPIEREFAREFQTLESRVKEYNLVKKKISKLSRAKREMVLACVDYEIKHGRVHVNENGEASLQIVVPS